MKTLLVLLFCTPLLLWAQSDDTPTLFEVVGMQVKADMEDDFEAAVKMHNEKFHPEGPHQAQLFFNINGPHAGYQWVMGPTNYAALDSRPADEAHDQDWAKVMDMVESATPPRYWNMDATNSQLTGNTARTKSMVWMYDLEPGKGAQWGQLISQVKEVYEKSRSDEDFFVGWNALANADGEDAVLIFTMENWAELDQQRNFGKEFEEVHGVGTWHIFLNHVSECVKQRVDWMRERID